MNAQRGLYGQLRASEIDKLITFFFEQLNDDGPLRWERNQGSINLSEYCPTIRNRTHYSTKVV